MAMNEDSPQPVSFRQALLFWLKLGLISFGGPAGQIAIMHQELVEKRRWLSEKRFLHALNYCMVLPGPEAQQLATYIGWLMHRGLGGLAAGLLFILPAWLLLIGLGWGYMALGHLPLVAGVLYGVKPAVTAIVLFAAYRIGLRTLRNGWLVCLSLAAFLAIFLFKVPFPLIVLLAAAVGALGGRWRPEAFAVGGDESARHKHFGRSLLDDDSPPPSHVQFSRRRFIGLVGFSLALWTGAMALLCAGYGWQGALTQMAWFFTKAALLTFGGAYAVLPYVYQGAVEHFQWLTAQQMIDGLALGETTPGPLIIVVTFVGFVAGWSQALFGPGNEFWAGALAATVVTFFTFLPSFMFILAGGPLIEATHGKLKFTAPLTGITAAVVGVILNLAVFFALNVFWPKGLSGGFELWAALIGLMGFLALVRFKLGVIPVIGLSAVCGLLPGLVNGQF